MTTTNANTTLTLTTHEQMALLTKARTNRFGNVSLSLVGRLIRYGLVDSKSLRLTEEGIARVDQIRRLRDQPTPSRD